MRAAHVVVAVGVALAGAVVAYAQGIPSPGVQWPLRATNGTAAAPSMTFASDKDTGLFRVAANTIGLATGGTNRLSVGVSGEGDISLESNGSITGVNTNANLDLNGVVGARIRWGATGSESGVLTCGGSGCTANTATGTNNGFAVETGFLRFAKTSAGAPTGTDCDADAERGRLSIDVTNNRIYICNGATRGWDYAALTD